jgi:hypothetical protein
MQEARVKISKDFESLLKIDACLTKLKSNQILPNKINQ